MQAFLTRKWSKEQGYRLKKHLWAFEVGSRVRHEWMHAYALPLRPAMYEAFEFFFFFFFLRGIGKKKAFEYFQIFPEKGIKLPNK